VLPPGIGFVRLRVAPPEVVLETTNGSFSFDAISGGIAALVDVAWQIYTFSIAADSDFAVAIDEPENHLHPELQRSIVPSLLRAFPKAQFIVSTHNPLVITSEPNSRVYVLRFHEPNLVRSELLDFVNKAGTADETLRDVLGLPNTLPQWATVQLERILVEKAERGIDDETVAELRTELRQLGLGYLLPETIAELISNEASS
jgi:hypothetical protein